MDSKPLIMKVYTMNLGFVKYIFLILCFGLLSGCMSVNAMDTCNSSFADYAYWVKPDKAKELSLSGEPFGEWKQVSTLPNTPLIGDLAISVVAYRNTERHSEVWIKVGPPSDNYRNDDREYYEFLVYDIDLQSWRRIPASIVDTEAYASDLYVTKDGNLWGLVRWDDYTTDKNYPILCKLNSETQRFELVENIQSIPTVWRGSTLAESRLPVWALLVLDSQDTFWIFSPKDGLYRYNSYSQEITRLIDIPDRVITHASLAPNGNIYFQKHYQSAMRFQIERDELFQYNPETNLITDIKSPSGVWPAGDIYVDHVGKLWIGSVGYREPDGTWVKLHPFPLLYLWQTQVEGNYRWGTPDIVMESSNGYLWFQSTLGMAWLDTQSREGCWFTSESTGMIEFEQNIWMVQDGHLFTQSLNP